MVISIFQAIQTKEVECESEDDEDAASLGGVSSPFDWI